MVRVPHYSIADVGRERDVDPGRVGAIAFGFPSADGPVIFDIGTASLMWGEVLLAAETAEALPPGLAFDADGNPTVDGRAAARGGVAAFGGHKGYGLAFAIQALGLLAGAAIPRGQVQDYGFLFPVIDPGALLPGNRFAAQMSQLVKAIQATLRRPGVEEIRTHRSAPFANASADAPKASSSTVR